MNFALTDQQEAIRDAIAKICAGLDDAYWLNKDREGVFRMTFTKRLPMPDGSASACRKPMAALA